MRKREDVNRCGISSVTREEIETRRNYSLPRPVLAFGVLSSHEILPSDFDDSISMSQPRSVLALSKLKCAFLAFRVQRYCSSISSTAFLNTPCQLAQSFRLAILGSLRNSYIPALLSMSASRSPCFLCLRTSLFEIKTTSTMVSGTILFGNGASTL